MGGCGWVRVHYSVFSIPYCLIFSWDFIFAIFANGFEFAKFYL